MMTDNANGAQALSGSSPSCHWVRGRELPCQPHILYTASPDCMYSIVECAVFEADLTRRCR